MSTPGWRPDSSGPQRKEAQRAVPPALNPLAPLLFGNPNAVKHLGDRTVDLINSVVDSPCADVLVVVETPYTSKIGFARSYIKTPDNKVSPQSWILGFGDGWDRKGM